MCIKPIKFQGKLRLTDWIRSWSLSEQQQSPNLQLLSVIIKYHPVHSPEIHTRKISKAVQKHKTRIFQHDFSLKLGKAFGNKSWIVIFANTIERCWPSDYMQIVIALVIYWHTQKKFLPISIIRWKSEIRSTFCQELMKASCNPKRNSFMQNKQAKEKFIIFFWVKLRTK